MSQFRRKDARHYPILQLEPGSGTGIQFTPGRTQQYTIWNSGFIEAFCDTADEAFFTLQDVLDGNRVGEDYEEEDEEEDDF